MTGEPAREVERATDALGRGEPVLVYDADDREAETDLVYPADAVTPAAVARLRNDAGGLVCVAVPDDVAAAFDLPFLADAVDHPAAHGRPGYDTRAAQSLPVNARSTGTGVTDRDRATTIRALADAATEAGDDGAGAVAFAERFRTPGHVQLLRGAPEGLDRRQGHTELALALVAAAGRAPAAVVCEMLSDGDGALATDEARAYADERGLAFVSGAAVIDRRRG